MYHSISKDEIGGFIKQLGILRSGYRVVGADFREQDALPGDRYVALTFDDGFENFERLIYPVLRQMQIPATVFIPTGSIGQRALWMTDEEEHEKVMTESALRHLSGEGLVSFGSHSVSHIRLSSSSMTEAVIKYELEYSKRQLETILSHPVASLALPYGVYDDLVLSMAESVGYKRIFLSIPLGSCSNLDGLIAGRLEASPKDSSFVFWLKARGGFQYLPVLISLKARLRHAFSRFRSSGS